MSRGPGRIQKTIEAAFMEHPDDIFALEELIVIAFPGLHQIEKKHRVSVIRAAKPACERTGWDMRHQNAVGSPLWYFNKRSVDSYALAVAATYTSGTGNIAQDRESAHRFKGRFHELKSASMKSWIEDCRAQVAKWTEELNVSN